MHPIWTLLRCVVAASLIFFIAASAIAQPRDAATMRPSAMELDASQRIARAFDPRPGEIRAPGQARPGSPRRAC
jgi:hypothetical protein